MFVNVCEWNVSNKVCWISCITNMAAGITGQPLDDKEVVEVAANVADKLETILYNLVIEM